MKFEVTAGTNFSDENSAFNGEILKGPLSSNTPFPYMMDCLALWTETILPG